jgi:ribonuclease HI
MESKKLTVYCDGSCRPFQNPDKTKFKIAGCGIYFGENDERNTSCEVMGEQTNNRAELSAILKVLELTMDYKGELEIITDSLYSINTVIKAWKPKCNFDLLEKIWKLLKERQDHCKVTFSWIRGHCGDIGNEMADKLANEAVTNLYRVLTE